MTREVVISLCDLTGAMVQPWVESGYDAILVDPQHEPGDVLLITGVGDAFPFMRVHSLLEALQPYFSDVPILVMYPGEFDGHHLKLFNRLKPNDYYRAFDRIE